MQQSSAEQGPSRISPPAHRAVDIPGASHYAVHPESRSLESGLHLSSPDGAFLGSLSLGYGTSPGHGHGHLMRSRRRQLGRQSSSKEFPLPSHNELGDLVDALENGSPELLDPPPSAASPHSVSHVDDDKFFFSGNELTAPLLSTRAPADVRLTSQEDKNTTRTQASKAAVFGAINAIAGIPALVAYAAIVFRHPAYTPFLDLLCKFFFISSALHQAVFCLLSTLPFAMGQVQDVGIIFLSAMGTSIAELALDNGRDAATALGTSLLTMTTSTLIVGLGTLFVAKRSLASFVHYIPLPVMGGYLAFVGYFCIASGVGLGTTVEISSIASWGGLFSRLPLLKLIPTLASCGAMVLTLEKVHHHLALPSILVLLVIAFHVVLHVFGISLSQAQASGWVLPPSAGPVKFWELWGLYHFESWSLSGIYFPAMWRQVGKTLGLMLVVIFGSCMDIAAIQQDVTRRIDFNRELTTVAVSNIATGVAFVGFTGSYIFSQTIFTMRAGVDSRINGWVIAATEFAVFVYPYSIVQYFPNYFLGALLVWFGFEITRDWLVLSYFKLTLVEYGLLWLTFASVMQWGLEGGIAAGIISATLYFAYAYARSQVESTQAGRARSSVVRTVEHQAALGALGRTHVATAHLQGFVFFGSAQSIGSKLHEAAARLIRPLNEAGGAEDEDGAEDFGDGGKHRAALAAIAAAPRFFVLDFSKVTGMDSSGARTIADVARDFSGIGITPILTSADHHGIVGLLGAHDVPLQAMQWPPDLRPAPPLPASNNVDISSQGEVAAAPTLMDNNNRNTITTANNLEHEPRVLLFKYREEGLRFCEDALLEVAVQYGLCTAPGEGTTLEDLLASHLQSLPLTAASNAPAMASTLRRYLTQRTIRRGEALWNISDPAEELFLVERGVIRVDQFAKIEEEEDENDGISGDGSGSEEEEEKREGEGDPAALLMHDWGLRGRRKTRRVRVRSFELGPGCVAGSTDFYLARPHRTRAVCASVACRVLRFSRHAMQKMAFEAPAALNILQMAVMRLNTSDLAAAADVNTAGPL